MTPSRKLPQRMAMLAATLSVFAALAVCASPALAAYTRPFLHAFGPRGFSSGGPTGAFSNLQSIAVEQTTKDVYVYDAGYEGGSIYKFNAAGEPVDFSALASNVIEHVGAVGADEGELAVDSSSGPDSGDIFFASGESDGNTVLIYNAQGEAAGQLKETAGAPWGEPCGVAVNPAGNVYVGIYPEHVNEYTPKSGTVTNSDYVGSLFGLEDVCNIATDAQGDVYTNSYASHPEGVVTKYAASQFNTSETPASGDHVNEHSATLATDPVTNEVFVDELTAIGEYNSTGTRLATFGATGGGALSGSFGVAVDHVSDDVYASNGFDGAVEIFGPAAVVPDVTTSPATSETPAGAAVHGTVNPDDTEVTACEFEYGAGETYGQTAPCSPATPYSGEDSLAVSAQLTGLERSTTYHYRLVARNTSGASYSRDDTLATTSAYPPTVSLGPVTAVGENTATFSGTINPHEGDTTYYFEDSTDGQSWSPLAEANLPANTGESQVTQTVALRASTAYYVRLVAANAGGTSISAQATFTTLTVGPSEHHASSGCPNEQLREESDLDPDTDEASSLGLPDCRAYELVTPLFKDGDSVTTGVPSYGATAIAEVSTDGSPLRALSLPILGKAGTDSEKQATSYELARSATGWTVNSLNPLASTFPLAKEELGSSEDAATGLWVAATPTQPVRAADIYRRELDGSFVEVGPLAPPSATEGPARGQNHATEDLLTQERGALDHSEVMGASEDLSKVLFNINPPEANSEQSYLWPRDSTVEAKTNGNRPSLYEYVGTGHTGTGTDVPTLVGVDNRGAQISQCGTALGSYLAPTNTGSVRNAVSASGSTVFFNAQQGGCEATEGPPGTGPAVNQLYARIGAPGSDQVTVNVAAASQSECEIAASCAATAPVTYQGASKSGAQMYFTTTQALIPGLDKDTGNDIYECELPADADAIPPSAGIVSACPDLKAVSVTGTSSGADVQSVVAVSEEGARVYFIATGVLTTEANNQGHVATAGSNNLYVSDTATGTTRFIAALPSSSLAEAQATPDGGYLVFTSAADLTTDDLSTAAQVFRYNAETSELIRVSTGQNGFNENGNTSSFPATLANSRLGRLTMSDDGTIIVFESNDALTREIHGGIHNVYEWRDGTVYLISDGTDTDDYAGLIGTDRSGDDVFFTTESQLVHQDTDHSVDVYDARIDGGFPAPTPEAGCSGEACQGPLSSSLIAPSPLIASAGMPAIGNLAPPKKTTASSVKVNIDKHSLKGSTITLFVSTSGSGELSASGTGVRTEKRAVTKAGTYTLKLTLTKAGKASSHRHHKLKLKIKVSFVPSAGKAASATLTLTAKT